ncbi:MAG: Copper-exporting ATPase [Candidatus Giovannonibacteria bacterium GW2011_GWB1_46_20]|uniref:Copper-exporting ATPase n=2 Tax=Candidatus Giovannoniibacteriota TaxID=1752738 RepID=A0A0G1IJ49_9BACT|nr:MAG: heavy metal translocating p-type atpase, Cu2+-exporting ATPase [Parcubacteria group bacterium GW2011_GWC1_44_10]KKT59185.1 MAG: Copper-exporting ATPase [Candidatus Giovannonibacteria bacterium GW2011_GWA1_44_25]KKU29909.1 MAG: Copper-exporting ATPase [Candidatus Giovannonibacteria bacterium GW2011_GWB1_46_20]
MATIKKKYNVEGMHCGACATGIQMYLSNTEGVKSVSVDYNSKKAEIEYDDKKINDAGIAKNVEELGYKIKPE